MSTLEANIDALVDSKPGEKATKTRARRILREFEADTPEKIRTVGKIKLMRAPNCGMKTTKWILEVLGEGQTHRPRVPKAKKPPPPKLTLEQKLSKARYEIGHLRRIMERQRQQLLEHAGHVRELNNYNERMRQTVKDVIAAYYHRWLQPAPKDDAA